MIGLGIIYRLFRSGRLNADDEVAVAFHGEEVNRACSVPLVNVRYALSRALRRQQLTGPEGERVLQAARSLFYADRTWPRILSGAGLRAGAVELGAMLAQYDLKASDAVRALRWADARMTAPAPEAAVSVSARRDGRRSLLAANTPRERQHDSFGGGTVPAVRADVCAHAFTSGHFRRHLAALTAELPGRREGKAASSPRPSGHDRMSGEDARFWLRAHGTTAPAFGQALRRRRAADSLLAHLEKAPGSLDDVLWAELLAAGE